MDTSVIRRLDTVPPEANGRHFLASRRGMGRLMAPAKGATDRRTTDNVVRSVKASGRGGVMANEALGETMGLMSGGSSSSSAVTTARWRTGRNGTAYRGA